MEWIIGLLLIGIALWFGLFKPVETVAHAIDDEVSVFAAERKATNVDRLSEIDISEEKVKTAQSNLAKLNAIKL